MNRKKPLILLIGLVLISTTFAGAYESVNGITLPDSPVTINVVNGATSYFNITLSNVPAGNDITNGMYPGWCAQMDTYMPRNTNLIVTLYDSYDPNLPAAFQSNNWDKINWVLNNKASHSKWTIQYSIWYLLGQYPYNLLSGVEKYIVDHAVDGFVPQEGQILAIIAVPQRTDAQCSFIEYVIPGDYEGLTPGYWKNHLGAWHTYTPTTKLSSVFTNTVHYPTLNGNNLLDALKYNGGKNDIGAARILLRSAVAALLNAADPDINYPLSTAAIIHEVNDALLLHRTAMLNLAGTLDDYNNLGTS